MKNTQLKAGNNDDGRRIDRILRRYCQDMPVSAVYRLLRKGQVLIDGKRSEQGTRVRSGQVIEIRGADIPDVAARPANSVESKINVLYEDEDILAIDKPGGVSSQEELGAMVRGYLAGKIAPSLSFRPGPLHRLDRYASGVIVFGVSLAGAQQFSAMMRGSLLKKTYVALLEGCLYSAEICRDDLIYSGSARKTRIMGQTYGKNGGINKNNNEKVKYAQTRLSPLEVRGGLTLAEVEITTGRTHQIRAQAAARGFPLYGDRKYGSKNSPPFFLHACRLQFPKDSRFPSVISAPVPYAFSQKLIELGFHVPALG
ncbi:MAG: RluA family pseudouridine synthase [Spirochaetaceae bacterium]|jgi:23S rRNA pseudouridine955/2504/2580 synthase|nr:RluA family pseudouridine synthase [Spirochaetaceae bacterium]